MTPAVEGDARLSASEPVAANDAAALAAGLAAQPPLALALDPDFEPSNRLPPDHPPWARDAVALSQRARALLTRLRPVVVRVSAAWEHRVRSILGGGRRLSVDPSGCYRVD